MKCAFLVPFMGTLPPYFPFWAKSCEANAETFHWYVYHDGIAERRAYNSAVTLIPMTVAEMGSRFRDRLGIAIVESNLRKICDYRLLFYHLCRHEEPLDDYEFIGYTDLDMIYGRIGDFLPRDPTRFAVISADDDLPCGPFTMIRTPRLEGLDLAPRVRECLEHPRHRELDESKELLELLAGDQPVHCQARPLQPAMTSDFESRRLAAVWEDGRLTVSDPRGRRREGAFFHFRRYKDRWLFTPEEEALGRPRWHVDGLGIRSTARGNPWKLAWRRIVSR